MTERPPFPAEAFRRYDESPDDRFYAFPRLVTHIDDAAIAAVTQLYREYVPPGGAATFGGGYQQSPPPLRREH